MEALEVTDYQRSHGHSHHLIQTSGGEILSHSKSSLHKEYQGTREGLKGSNFFKVTQQIDGRAVVRDRSLNPPLTLHANGHTHVHIFSTPFSLSSS